MFSELSVPNPWTNVNWTDILNANLSVQLRAVQGFECLMITKFTNRRSAAPTVAILVVKLAAVVAARAGTKRKHFSVIF